MFSVASALEKIETFGKQINCLIISLNSLINVRKIVPQMHDLSMTIGNFLYYVRELEYY